ncbi:TraB/GumN family protein [Alkalibacillus haloalkaliphilus]|uniref:TraB/GumN family protein n=1 Tax=Alkalibacillus haloalkaliphilus TaxID=94136 RepID=UPI0002F7A5CA|nr:TraB/GumN family protein [Alkalibacillus haloalkaliphilus]
MSYKRLLKLTVLSFIAFVLIGCDEELTVDDVEIPEKSEAFFWEAEHNDKTIYFLGTVHAGHEEMYPMRDEIENAMDETELLLTEVDMSSAEAREELNEISRSYMYLPSGEKLEDYIPDEHMEEFKTLAEHPNMNYDVLNSLKPWAFLEFYSQQLIRETDYSFNNGVEYYLYDRMLDDTDLLPLEDYEVVIKNAHDQSMEYQEYLMEDALNMTEEGYFESIENSVVAWRTGEESLRGEELLTRESLEDSDHPELEEQYFEEMLFNRDEQMAERVDEIVHNHDADTIMVAPGFAHFFGPGNILELLEEKGYDIERK